MRDLNPRPTDLKSVAGTHENIDEDAVFDEHIHDADVRLYSGFNSGAYGPGIRINKKVSGRSKPDTFLINGERARGIMPGKATF